MDPNSTNQNAPDDSRGENRAGNLPEDRCPKSEWVLQTLADDELVEPGGALPQGLSFHLQRCPSCRNLATQIRATTDALATLAASETTGRCLDEANERTKAVLISGESLARFVDGEEDEFWQDIHASYRTFRIRRNWAVAAMIAMAVGLSGYMLLSLGSGNERRQPLAEQDDGNAAWPFPDVFPDVKEADRINAQASNAARTASDTTPATSWVDKVVVETPGRHRESRRGLANEDAPQRQRQRRRTLRRNLLIDDDLLDSTGSTQAAFTFSKSPD
ncbi:MAG: hypothetical protein ACYTHJ_10710 [Planctomycetota bacterium]|jgi:hypothetical protein